MTEMQQTITQHEAKELMERLGFDVSIRTLSNWRTKGALPELRRLDGGDGHRAGPAYVWDRDVILQLHTIVDAMDEHAVIEDAMLFAWWAGFEYPIERMRGIWLHWARSEKALLMRDLPTGDFDPVKERELIGQLPNMMRQSSRKMRQIPETYLDTLVQVYVDPFFEATELNPRQTEGLRHDVARFAEAQEEVMAAWLSQFVPDDRVRSVVGFVHAYFSPATLPTLLKDISTALLAQAHADWHVLSGVYRWLLQDTIDDLLDGIGGDHKIARFVLLRAFCKLGRGAILCDIGLRQHGHGAAVDAFVTRLAALGDDLEVRRGAAKFRRVLNELTGVLMTEVPDAARQRTEICEAIYNETPEIGTVIKRVSDTVGSLWDLVPPAMKDDLTTA